MRRPTTIVGMLLHLARLNPRPVALGACALTTVAGIGLGVALGRGLTPEAAVTPRAPAVDLRVGALLAPGRCVSSGAVCVHDVTCGGGDRCVDETNLRARVTAALAATPVAPCDDEPVASISPSLARNGDGWGVAWAGFFDEHVDLYFARLDANGRRVGNPVRLTRTATMKIAPQLVRGRNGWIVTWTDVGESDVNSYVLRLKDDGSPDGNPAKVSNAGGIQILPRAVWNGSEYALSWLDLGVMQQMSVRFQRLSTSGGRVGSESTLARGQFVTGVPSLGFMGDGYGYGWTHYHGRDDRSTARFARVGAGGAVTATVNVAQGQGRAGGAAVAWGGTRFGMVWEDDVKAEDEDSLESALVFAGVGARDVEVPRVNVTQRDALHLQPDLAHVGDQYGLAWTRISGDGASVMLGRLDANGALRARPAAVNGGDAFALFPTITASGQGFAVAWTQIGRDGVVTMFARYGADGQRVGAPVIVAGDTASE